MVQKLFCERYLSIQIMLEKKGAEKKKFKISGYTYLPKTIFFPLLFYEPFPYNEVICQGFKNVYDHYQFN